MIVIGSPSATIYRDLIIALAAKHRLPTVYYARFYATGGGLISYGRISSTSTGAQPATLIAFSEARSRPICRCRRQPSMS